MKKMQSGFTLIELVMVIVILGILAASALPKFVDLSTEAEAAALQGVAGAIRGASAVNYASHSAGSGAAELFVDTTDTCTTMAAAILIEGVVPAGYTLPTVAITSTNGTVQTCLLTQTSTANSENVQIIWTE